MMFEERLNCKNVSDFNIINPEKDSISSSPILFESKLKLREESYSRGIRFSIISPIPEPIWLESKFNERDFRF